MSVTPTYARTSPPTPANELREQSIRAKLEEAFAHIQSTSNYLNTAAERLHGPRPSEMSTPTPAPAGIWDLVNYVLNESRVAAMTAESLANDLS